MSTTYRTVTGHRIVAGAGARRSMQGDVAGVAVVLRLIVEALDSIDPGTKQAIARALKTAAANADANGLSVMRGTILDLATMVTTDRPIF